MRLKFLGAAGTVTGSSYLLEIADRRILIDCGMFQGSKTIAGLNREAFAYDPKSIDCVLLTHAHIDHSGLLPKLCKAGFKGPIYATKVTTELCGIMLPDSAHIQEFDAEIANRKGQRAGRALVEPLYVVDDAYNCLQQFSTVDYDTKLDFFPEVAIKFRDAGHILGSAFLEIWVTEAGKTVKLLFSGDLGQPDQPLVKDPAVVEEADYVITESTYGNRVHEHGDKQEQLAAIINDTVSRGGNVIIPSFAVGRTQTLLYYLHNLYKMQRIPAIPVIIDSPLAISATNIFVNNPQNYDSAAEEIINSEHDSPLTMPHLLFTKTSEESKALNKLKHPAIIISASGMADAGRILHHLKHNLWRPESTVLFVGYQAQGSLGRRLLEGARHVRIMGELISVKAKIISMDGFSAHADREELLVWLSRFHTPPVNIFIVHGEKDMAEPFAELLQTRFGYSTYIPRRGDTAVISEREWQIEPAGESIANQAVIALAETLSQMAQNYRLWRNRLEEMVAADERNLPPILNALGKINKYVTKVMRNL